MPAAFAQADLQRQSDDLSSASAAAAAADFEAEHSAFSAPLRAHVARTVTTSTLAAYEAEDDEYASFGAVQRSDIFTDEVDAAIFGQQSPILKEGWLRKLARFGRDLNRCGCRCHLYRRASAVPMIFRFDSLAFAPAVVCFSWLH